MTARPSRFPAAGKRRPSARIGSGQVAVFVGSLFIAAVFFQPPAHSATLNPGAGTEAAATRSSTSTASIAELEEGFWVCDYLATKGRVDIQEGATCGSITEELKQKKFVGDFGKLLEWWRLNKIAQHKALEATAAAQY